MLEKLLEVPLPMMNYETLLKELDSNKIIAIVPYAQRNDQVKYKAENTNTQRVKISL
ncbi:MAG: hypothetical protein NZ841_05370 [Dictyoglomus sp.]|nr:hypothetical protein [Dictyoglomus sp.]MCX7942031.1 hypothetical protein [Dictyoglomaceae bacterium]MDW8188707.1 hypothetical protein [Dictyoglomus sp.]